MEPHSPDPATFAALTDTINFELRAQLVDAGLGLEEIEQVASMVLAEWHVVRRPS